MAALGDIAQEALQQAERRIRHRQACLNRQPWTADQVEQLIKRYPTESAEAIAIDLGITVARVYAKANNLGLHKESAVMAEILKECGRKARDAGKAYWFQKGQTAWNKGLKGLNLGGRETQFGKGHMPHNWVPVGTEQIRDGYLWRKVTDTRSRHDWKQVHVMLWEEHNGPIPEGFILCFRDGIKSHITIDNLELITRAERMRRNTIHRYPPELKATMHQLRKLNKAIQEKEDEKSA